MSSDETSAFPADLREDLEYLGIFEQKVLDAVAALETRNAQQDARLNASLAALFGEKQ